MIRDPGKTWGKNTFRVIRVPGKTWGKNTFRMIRDQSKDEWNDTHLESRVFLRCTKEFQKTRT